MNHNTNNNNDMCNMINNTRHNTNIIINTHIKNNINIQKQTNNTIIIIIIIRTIIHIINKNSTRIINYININFRIFILILMFNIIKYE